MDPMGIHGTHVVSPPILMAFHPPDLPSLVGNFFLVPRHVGRGVATIQKCHYLVCTLAQGGNSSVIAVSCDDLFFSVFFYDEAGKKNR